MSSAGVDGRGSGEKSYESEMIPMRTPSPSTPYSSRARGTLSGSVRLAGTARHESSVTSVLGCAGASVSVSVTFSAFAVFHADPLEAGVSVS